MNGNKAGMMNNLTRMEEANNSWNGIPFGQKAVETNWTSDQTI